MSNKEVRYSHEVRAGAENVLEGYAARYGVTADLGRFHERVAPGAFTRSIETGDVRALYNHNSDLVLARTKSGTLTLRDDDQGLYFSMDLPDTQAGRDLRALVARGDVDGCSFGFVVTEQDWEDRQEGQSPTRVLREVELIEISVCGWPAYPDTSVALRALDALPRTVKPTDRARMRLRLAEKT